MGNSSEKPAGSDPEKPAEPSYYEMVTAGYTQLVDAIIRPPRAEYETADLG